MRIKPRQATFTKRKRGSSKRPGATRGFTLVELMIALALGVIVVGAAIAVFLSNKDSYRTNIALAQVQDNSRIAFELLARDIRQAGITGCGNAGRMANVLNNGTTKTTTPDWYANFGNVIRGYDGGTADPAVNSSTASGDRFSTASSLTLLGAAMASVSVATYTPSTGAITLTGTNPGIASGDLVIVCDPDHAVMAQVTSVSGSTLTIGTTGTPGNCSLGLGFPSDCSSSTGNTYVYGANALLSPLQAVDWYIGNNPLGGTSLYRRTLINASGVPNVTAQEMVRNATDLQLAYYATGATSFMTAASVADWTTVSAVQMTLVLKGIERNTGTDGQPISRQFTTTVEMRNRN